MRIHTLPADPGRKQKAKRVGRGEGSGLGKQSGKGNKGHKARAGGGKRGAFEGGQMPLVRRLPKGGFKSPFRVEYEVVNLSTLEKKFAAGATVDAESLRKAGVTTTTMPVKVLANGELKKKLSVKVHKASAAAVEKIQAAGGSFEAVQD